jgi:hypothetical protein
MAVHPVARTDTSTASTQSQASGQSTAERASANVISEHQVQYANRLRVHLMTFQGHAHPALVGQERTDTSEQPVMSRSHLAQQHQRRRRPHQLQWTEPAREMSIHREHPGKMGRRRLRRYNNGESDCLYSMGHRYSYCVIRPFCRPSMCCSSTGRSSSTHLFGKITILF